MRCNRRFILRGTPIQFCLYTFLSNSLSQIIIVKVISLLLQKSIGEKTNSNRTFVFCRICGCDGDHPDRNPGARCCSCDLVCHFWINHLWSIAVLSSKVGVKTILQWKSMEKRPRGRKSLQIYRRKQRTYYESHH